MRDVLEVSPAEPALRRIPMSWEEYERTPVRGEYVDGALVVTAFASQRHQRACRRLANVLEAQVRPGHAVHESWGWKPGGEEFGPDVMLTRVTEEETRFTGTPLLVAEVLSDRRHDLVTKKAKYARYGAPRYWVLDPQAVTLLALELHDGRWEQVSLVVAGQAAALETGAGPVTVDPADLLR